LLMKGEKQLDSVRSTIMTQFHNLEQSIMLTLQVRTRDPSRRKTLHIVHTHIYTHTYIHTRFVADHDEDEKEEEKWNVRTNMMITVPCCTHCCDLYH